MDVSVSSCHRRTASSRVIGAPSPIRGTCCSNARSTSRAVNGSGLNPPRSTKRVRLENMSARFATSSAMAVLPIPAGPEISTAGAAVACELESIASIPDISWSRPLKSAVRCGATAVERSSSTVLDRGWARAARSNPSRAAAFSPSASVNSRTVRLWGDVITPRSMSLMARALMPECSESASRVRSAANRSDLNYAANDIPGFPNNFVELLHAFCIPTRRTHAVE